MSTVCDLPMICQVEEWRPVVGYEGFYEVSNLGNVRSIDRIIKYKKSGKSLRRGRTMRLNTNRYGYIDLKLCKNGQEKAHLVHRLVANAFLINPETKPQVNHKNGVKNDNRLENLEWATLSENRLHSFRELNADCWLRHVKGRLHYITNGAQTKRIVGDYVLPHGWNHGRHSSNQSAIRSAA